MSDINKTILILTAQFGAGHVSAANAIKEYILEKNPNYNNHKVSGGNNGRAKKVFCITTGEIFDCAIDAGKKYGIKRGLIPACCRGEQKTAGGKEWKYL